MRKFINTSTSDINEMYQKDFKKTLFNLFSPYVRIFHIQSTKDALHFTFVNTGLTGMLVTRRPAVSQGISLF